MAILSKSNYLRGLQCPKLLWTTINNREIIPPVSSATQRRFDQGHLVGELAHKLFPGGVNITTIDLLEAIRQSEEPIGLRKTIFEAGIKSGHIAARPDILKPVGNDAWDIIEVKSATDFSTTNIEDVSFQKYCYEKAGMKIRKCFIITIDNSYIKNGEIDPKKIFKKDDVTEDVVDEMEGIKDEIKEMLTIIRRDRCPTAKIGKRCKNPYKCPLIEKCWASMPENNVFKLRNGRDLPTELFENGIKSIKDIPEECELDYVQEIQRKVERTGRPHIDKSNIKKFLKKLEYPLYYLDFESFAIAIPVVDGTRPYQQVPFQFSLHVVKNVNSKPVHCSFLDERTDGLNTKFLLELKKVLGDKGSIVAYNTRFEKSVLTELGVRFPQHKKWIDGVLARFVDLLLPFSRFFYYNSKQQGSASLKKVLPAITGTSYDNLEINDGQLAGYEYARITYGNNIPEEDRGAVRENLLKYCCLDTEGMIWIVDKLDKLTSL